MILLPSFSAAYLHLVFFFPHRHVSDSYDYEVIQHHLTCVSTGSSALSYSSREMGSTSSWSQSRLMGVHKRRWGYHRLFANSFESVLHEDNSYSSSHLSLRRSLSTNARVERLRIFVISGFASCKSV
jgi:hypothetical protein